MESGRVNFFFCGTFHNIFKLGTPYGPIPAQVPVEKLPKPPYGGFGKNHCREYLIGYSLISMEHKRLIAQRDNNRSTRYKLSFSGKDSLKTLPIPNGTHTQPGSK